LLRELTWRQSNRSKKADIVNCYYRWQVFWKRKARRSFPVSQNTKREREKATLRGMAHLWGSVK
jgi:hypothetical protein